MIPAMALEGTSKGGAQMSVTTGMIGHGFYDSNSAPQGAATEAVLPWLDAAIAAMELADPPQAIGIADFGCSEGRNSTAVLTRLIAGLRARTDRPIATVQSDLPTNDFSALLRNLRPGGAPLWGPEVYSSVLGGSMFGRLLPPQSLHLAMTFNAIGFLSRRPLDQLPGYLLPNGPGRPGSAAYVSDTDLAIFADQAAADLETFLTARAAELVPGGKLLVEVFGATEAARTCDGIYDVLNDAVLEAVEDGIIDRAAYDRYYQPVYFRTLEELTASVSGPDASLSHLYELDRAGAYESPVSFNEARAAGGDIAAYARDYTNFFRAFTEAVLCAAFPDKEPQSFANDIFARAERRVREDPDAYPFRYVSVAMLLTRKAG